MTLYPTATEPIRGRGGGTGAIQLVLALATCSLLSTLPTLGW